MLEPIIIITIRWGGKSGISPKLIKSAFTIFNSGRALTGKVTPNNKIT